MCSNGGIFAGGFEAGRRWSSYISSERDRVRESRDCPSTQLESLLVANNKRWWECNCNVNLEYVCTRKSAPQYPAFRIRPTAGRITTTHDAIQQLEVPGFGGEIYLTAGVNRGEDLIVTRSWGFVATTITRLAGGFGSANCCSKGPG